MSLKKMRLEADQGNIPPTKGTHRARCEKVELKESSAGNPYLSFRYKILTKGEEGRTVFDNVTLIPSTAFRYTRVFHAFGIKADKRGGFSGLEESMFEGRTVTLVITHEDYQGEQQARVQEIRPAGKQKAAGVPDMAETPAKKRKAKKVKAAPEPEPEADEDDEDEAEEVEETPKPKKRKAPAKKTKKAPEPEPEDEDEDDDEEEEVDEDEIDLDDEDEDEDEDDEDYEDDEDEDDPEDDLPF